jgi:hypothetical protein
VIPCLTGGTLKGHFFPVIHTSIGLIFQRNIFFKIKANCTHDFAWALVLLFSNQLAGKVQEIL